MITDSLAASPKSSTTGWFERSRISPLRLGTGLGAIVYLFVSLVLLERRFVSAFNDSLTAASYWFCLICAGAICIGLKCLGESASLRLTERTSFIWGTLLSSSLLLFSVAVLPEAWSWKLVFCVTGWVVFVSWFCCSDKSVQLIQKWVSCYVTPVVVEFLQSNPAEPVPQAAPPIKTSVNDDQPGTLAARGGTYTSVHGLRVVMESEHDVDGPHLKINPNGLGEELISGQVEPESESETGQIQSRTVRRIEANGDDVLEATATARFTRGSRQTVLHIPFTPVFSLPPHVECEVSDGSDVRLKVGAVFTYGVRLELKRNVGDLEEQFVEIDLFAICSAGDETKE